MFKAKDGMEYKDHSTKIKKDRLSTTKNISCNYFGKNYIWVDVTKNNVRYKKRRTWRYGYINYTSFILNPHNNDLERYHNRAGKNLSFS